MHTWTGAGGGKQRKMDNTSSAFAAMNIGVGVGAKDSKAGRHLGLRRSTTVDRFVGCSDLNGDLRVRLSFFAHLISRAVSVSQWMVTTLAYH
jgi:hypothetical protein